MEMRPRGYNGGKKYTYKGARSVYMRACDSSGCAGWW